MSAPRDAALAGLVLAATGIAVLAVGATLAGRWAAFGALGTVAFELLTSLDPATVRRHWDRPVVQAGAVGLALSGVALGAWLAPPIVLSASVGALVAYLLLLAGSTAIGLPSPPRTE